MQGDIRVDPEGNRVTDLTNVQKFIALQEDRRLQGRVTTLEDFRQHLGDGRRREALERILGTFDLVAMSRSLPVDGRNSPFEEQARHVLTEIHRIATEALTEEVNPSTAISAIPAAAPEPLEEES